MNEPKVGESVPAGYVLRRQIERMAEEVNARRTCKGHR